MSRWRAWLAEAYTKRAAAAPEDFDWSWPWDRFPRLERQWVQREALRAAPIVWGVACLAFTERDQSEAYNPATLVYSADPQLLAAPERLDGIGSRLGALWDEGPCPAFLEPWRARLRGGDLDTSRPAPEAICGPYAVFVSRTIVVRAHLPGERMRFDLMPVLALPEPASPVMILPAKLWPTEMAEAWIAACTREDAATSAEPGGEGEAGGSGTDQRGA